MRELYEKYRTALLNRKYYGKRLSDMHRLNLIFEILIALGTSSALGAWIIWRDSLGSTFWAVISGLAAILAVVKPILNITGKIERYTKLFVGHGDVFFDLERIVKDVERLRDYTREMDESFENAVNRLRELAPEDDASPSAKILDLCFREVNREVPAERLWIPQKG